LATVCAVQQRCGRSAECCILVALSQSDGRSPLTFARHCSGYASHEPGLKLIQEYNVLRKQIESLQAQLRLAE
jgi:hypothetical protein